MALWALICAFVTTGILVHAPWLTEGYPTVLAMKPNGKYRVTADARGLSELMETSDLVLPFIPDLLMGFQGMKYLGKMDFRDGFLSIARGQGGLAQAGDDYAVWRVRVHAPANGNV